MRDVISGTLSVCTQRAMNVRVFENVSTGIRHLSLYESDTPYNRDLLLYKFKQYVVDYVSEMDKTFKLAKLDDVLSGLFTT